MNRIERLYHSLRIALQPNSAKRVAYMRQKKLFGQLGNNVLIQKRSLPLYSELIYIHDNVKIASNVGFVTHDVIHSMLNGKFGGGFVERVGCIEIMDNVFIGSGTRILYDTRIGSNVIIGSGSMVTKDIPDNSVVAGVPARYICSFDEYVRKAKQYSQDFAEEYGMKKLTGMSTELAERMYQNFIKKREI